MNLQMKLKSYIKFLLSQNIFRKQECLADLSHRLYKHDMSYQIDMMLLPSYIKVIESQEFKQKYLDLINGLDEDSILTVSRIITRANQIRNLNKSHIDIFSNEEKEVLDYLKYEYVPSFVKLDDGLFSYKTWLFPSDDVSPCAAYYRHFIDDLESVHELKGSCIIDAGAFIGDSALFMSPYTNEKIYAFEPVQTNYELLLKTIELNNISNIIPVKMGLGSRNETINMINEMSSSRYVENPGQNTEPTRVTTLDDFVEENKLHIGLIKVDVEGFEKELLKGAIKTLQAQRPSLLLSIYHSGGDFFDIKKIIEQLNLGYRFKIKQQFAGAVLPETLLIAEVS